MHQIYITAMFTTLIIIGIFVFLLRALKPKTPVLWLVLLALMELPLQPDALYYIRWPFNDWLVAQMGKTPLYEFITLWYAPVTEELAKLLPAVVFLLLGKIQKENLSDWFLPIGFGFGLGEAWMLAVILGVYNAYPTMHWYQFDGYLFERLQVCFCHGAMCGLGLYLSVGKGRWILGTLAAFALHFALNAPLYYVPKLGFSPTGVVFWVGISLWVLLFFLGSIALIIGSRAATQVGVKLFGQAKCPRCETIYDRSLFGCNLGIVRYEKCPNCKTWNKTSQYVPEEAKPD